MANPIVHFEIGSKDGASSQKFYQGLFDWKFEEFGPARMISTGSEEGITGHLSSLGHEPHNYCVVYAQVDDLKEYLSKAEKLGGKTMVPPSPVPGMGYFAWLNDPEGNIVGLWKPDESAA
ncbi:MAG: VOC family protein [Candidatus Zixiibacteriota bacterium]